MVRYSLEFLFNALDHLPPYLVGISAAHINAKIQEIVAEDDAAAVKQITDKYKSMQSVCEKVLFFSIAWYTIEITVETYIISAILKGCFLNGESIIGPLLNNVTIVAGEVLLIIYYCLTLDNCHQTFKQLAFVSRYSFII